MRIATLPSGERRESHTGESLNAQIRDLAALSVELRGIEPLTFSMRTVGSGVC